MSLRHPSIRRFAPLLLLPLTACARGQAGGFQMPPAPVEVAEVRSGTVRDRFKALGTVEARETVKIANEIAAVVREMPFNEGQLVTEGQLLARLDDREIGAEAKRAEALRDQAHTQYDRVKQLFDANAASPQEMDDASSALKVAEANHAVAQAREDKTRLVSPLSGLVGRRLVSPGAYLDVGATITEVAAVDVMKVSFAAPERYLGQLKVGSTVDVTTTAFPNQVFHGQIRVVDPILDPATRTFQLVAHVPNPKRLLRPGMSADVSATLSERPNALTIPDEAVFAQGDQSFVYVVKADSTVVKQAITIGTRDSSRVEVVAGLAAGQRVVQAGYQKLYDGAHVMPIPGAGPEAAAAGGSQ